MHLLYKPDKLVDNDSQEPERIRSLTATAWWRVVPPKNNFGSKEF
jgi:hypothetical protein